MLFLNVWHYNDAIALGYDDIETAHPKFSSLSAISSTEISSDLNATMFN